MMMMNSLSLSLSQMLSLFQGGNILLELRPGTREGVQPIGWKLGGDVESKDKEPWDTEEMGGRLVGENCPLYCFIILYN
jgi:hypothetical protein